MPTRPVDLNNIKGRIAEALVESIFRRAEFKMTRFGRESDLRGMMKTGKDESFTPDFLVMKEVLGDEKTRGMYQTHMVEVKYRSNLGSYLLQQRRELKDSDFAKAKEKWPNLCVVFVTDRPSEMRSCFQALDLSDYEAGKHFKTVALYEVERFRIFQHNVKQHEELARKMFGLLSEIKRGILP